ncbi:MAG: septum formation initiator family protein [Patescibacteria group bacterium]
MNLTKENREIAEEQLAQLKNKKQKLSNDIENLNTEEGKETIFRENFGLAKEGENLIIVLDEKNKEEEKISSKSGFFSKLLFWRD